MFSHTVAFSSDVWWGIYQRIHLLDRQVPIKPLLVWLQALVKRQLSTRPLQLLHVGCLSAGLSTRVADAARALAIPIQLTAVDGHDLAMMAARSLTVWYPEITVVEATHWPIDGGYYYDAVIVSHSLGRLSPNEQCQWLKTLRPIVPTDSPLLVWHQPALGCFRAWRLRGVPASCRNMLLPVWQSKHLQPYQTMMGFQLIRVAPGVYYLEPV